MGYRHGGLIIECLWAGGAYAQPVAVHGTTLIDVSNKLTSQRSPDPLTEGLGGSAWIDFDSDGDLDLFLTSGSNESNALFRNDGGAFTDKKDEIIPYHHGEELFAAARSPKFFLSTHTRQLVPSTSANTAMRCFIF